MAIVLGVVIFAQDALQAQTIVQIGTSTLVQQEIPYHQRPRNQTPRWAMLYREVDITANGGAPGRLARIEFNAQDQTDFFFSYGNDYTDVGQECEIFVGICENQYLRTNLTADRTFANLIDGTEGINPYQMTEQMKLVYEGIMFDEVVPTGTWAGVDFDDSYIYLGGNLVIAIRQNKPNHGGNDQRMQGSWRYTRNTAGGAWPVLYWNGNWPNPGNQNYWNTVHTGSRLSYNVPNIRLFIYEGIEASFPQDNPLRNPIIEPRRIIRHGAMYDQIVLRTSIFDDRAQPYLQIRSRAGQASEYTFRLGGPFPNYDNTIYQATDPNKAPNDPDRFNVDFVSNVTDLVTEWMRQAEGPAAGADGALDLRDKQKVVGGSYRLMATFTSPTTDQEWIQDFVITNDNDASVREILVPYSNDPPRSFKYPRGVLTPVSGRVENVGLNPVTHFIVTAKIYDSENNELYSDSKEITGVNLQTGENQVVDFEPFAKTDEVGLYTVCITVELKNADDESAINNTQCHEFEIQYDLEAQALYMNNPKDGEEVYNKMTFYPEGVIRNNGISDASNVDVEAVFTAPSGQTFTLETEVENIPAGAQPVFVRFDPFTPEEIGRYTVELRIKAPGIDPIRDNDIITSSFISLGNLEGEYEVGLGRDFDSIEEAVDALYIRGVSGPVTFILTDKNYNVGDINADNPALDLRSTMVGVGADNPILWEPSLERSLERGGITINLATNVGVGILFGQAAEPLNDNAIVHRFAEDVELLRQYTNPSGYMTFDGGENKSIRLQLESNAPLRAVVYMGLGSSNYAIKNCLIENNPNSKPSYEVVLPRQVRNQNNFTYEQDARIVNQQIVTYSAGIVIRNITPINAETGGNTDRLDTNTCDNNMIAYNEISHFGYGVVNLGAGMLLIESNGQYKEFYNKSNEIMDNRIWNVARAGIYSGYEQDGMITNNRIWNVGSSVNHPGEASGIIAGGNELYNNINVRIAANEISGVSSDTYSAGVKVEQVLNEFPALDGGNALFPRVDTDMKVYDNVIWGISRNDDAANMAGIHFLTQRDPDAVGPAAMLMPLRPEFFTRGDFVANNTIFMEDDMVQGNGVIAGISLQHSWSGKLYNNAIAMLTPVDASQDMNTAVFLQGSFPTQAGGLVSDRNAFWVAGKGAASLFHIEEITETSELIEAGRRDMFENLKQWKALANSDNNSVYGDFVSEHVWMNDSYGTPSLRIQTNPTPLGSILNNRGERLADVPTDVDGEERGAAEDRYDIGADEFNGQLLQLDIEAVAILSPRTYRRVNGTFSDAEYVMTPAPVSVRGSFRNNGSLPQSGVEVQAKLYVETPASNNLDPWSLTPQYVSVPVAEQTAKINVEDGETVEVEFDFGGGFSPQAYDQQGVTYTIPARFRHMARNVTPRYRIEITTTGDEYRPNNTQMSDVRFYIVRATEGIMMSAVGMNAEAPKALKEIAGKYNAENLIWGLNELNWYYEADPEPEFDQLTREGWEPYGVDYRSYNRVIYSSDTDEWSRQERTHVRDFLAAGTRKIRKHLLIGSQDVARHHVEANVIDDGAFVRQLLRAEPVDNPGGVGNTPFEGPEFYDQKRIGGLNVSKDLQEMVEHTGVDGDVNPQPVLVRVYSDENTKSRAQVAYKYLTLSPTGDETAMGTVVNADSYNVVFYGVDWRHIKRRGIPGQDKSGPQRMLRGALDVFDLNAGIELPIELADFTAYKVSEHSASIVWETASEQGSSRFELERSDASSDVRSYQVVAIREAAGNSSEIREYYVEDDNLRSTVYAYRLRMVDQDGSYSYSSEVEVDMRSGVQSGGVYLGSVNPNPVSVDAEFTYSLSEGGQVSLSLYDLQGKRVVSLYNGYRSSGEHSQSINVSTLPNGTYVYVLEVNGERLSKHVQVSK